jgi:hypothetical protein
MPTRSGEEGCRDEAAGQSAAKVGYRIAAMSFVIFLTVLKPDLSVVAGPSKPLSCNAAASLLHVCRPRFLD